MDIGLRYVIAVLEEDSVRGGGGWDYIPFQLIGDISGDVNVIAVQGYGRGSLNELASNRIGRVLTRWVVDGANNINRPLMGTQGEGCGAILGHMGEPGLGHELFKGGLGGETKVSGWGHDVRAWSWVLGSRFG